MESRQQGFTVLEVSIAGVIGALVVMGSTIMMQSGVEQHVQVVELQQQHHQLERFWTTTRAELGGANLGSIDIDAVGAFGSQLTFQFAVEHKDDGKTEFGADIEIIGDPVVAAEVLERPSTPGVARGDIHKDANKKPGHLGRKAADKRRKEVGNARAEADPKKAAKHLEKALKATKEKKWSVRYVVLEGETHDGDVAGNLYRLLIDDKDKVQSVERIVERVKSMKVATSGLVVVLAIELESGDTLDLQAVPKN